MENLRHSILVHELKLDKMGNILICWHCKKEILKTEYYHYSTRRPIGKKQYIKSYIHENCLNKSIK